MWLNDALVISVGYECNLWNPGDEWCFDRSYEHDFESLYSYNAFLTEC